MGRPDFPYDQAPPSDGEGIPIRGAEDVISNLHLVEVSKGIGPRMKNGDVIDASTFLTAGTYIACATGIGKTVERARKKAYSVVDAVHWPDKIFRDDIGEKVVKVLPELHRHGYARDMIPGVA